jgi:hypothetical protein
MEAVEVLTMNYYTLVTPERGVPCSQAEADALATILRESPDDDGQHGFTVDYEGGEVYPVAEEVGEWTALPAVFLTRLGALIARAGLPYLEFGAAFTAGRLVAGAHGGTAFRIYPDGSLVNRVETWPED